MGLTRVKSLQNSEIEQASRNRSFAKSIPKSQRNILRYTRRKYEQWEWMETTGQKLKKSRLGLASLQYVESEAESTCACQNAESLWPGKKLTKDGLCRFIENITKSVYYTTFRSKVNPSWYIGFTKTGRPKKAKRTGKNQDACHFVVRYSDHQHHDSTPQHLQRAVLDFQRRILQNSVLKRKRRHRVITEDPIDDEIAEEPLPDWINQRLINATVNEQKEWWWRAQNWHEAQQLLPSGASNSTLSSFEMENMEPATSKPERSGRRKQRKPKAGSRRRKQKQKTDSQPTSEPPRRRQIGETSIPKTPIGSQAASEPTVPPRIRSPKLSEIPRLHNKPSRRRHETDIDNILDTNTDGEPDEANDISNITDDNNNNNNNNRSEMKARASHRDSISRTKGRRASKSDSSDSGRTNSRRLKPERPRSTQ